MVHLLISRNIVLLSKIQPNWIKFVHEYLIKYEEVTKLDYINSTKTHKRFKSVKERRNLYTEYTEFVVFARGILELIPESEYTFEELVPEVIVTPNLTLEDIKHTLDVFDLRDDQIIAVNKCLKLRRGVIQLPTAVGKSAIITSVIKRLQEANPEMKTLVLAPTLSTVKNINGTLKEAGLDTTVYGHPEKKINAHITTALVQSLISSKDDTLLNDINAVFYDECLPGKSRILLPDGSSKSIAEIYEDDTINSVVSYDLVTQKYIVRKILRKFKTPYNDRFCRVYYRGLTETSGVTCTPNHKIYVLDKGYVPANEILPGDKIKVHYATLSNVMLNSYTYREVLRVSQNIGSTAAYKYNLEIEDTHNYFAEDVLVSNCHHLKCETWNKLNTMLPNVEYALGFSALSIDKSEIYKQNFKDLSYNAALIAGNTGRVLMHMDPSYYIQRGIIALPAVFRVNTSIRFPTGFDESKWHEVVKQGIMSTPRTIALTSIATIFNKYNRKVLILVPEKDYAFTISKYLVRAGATQFGISFGAGDGYLYKSSYEDDEGVHVEYTNEDSLEVLDKLSTSEINILIGSSHLDEGVNISKLDACILTCGGKTDRRIIQRLGRVLRKSKSGKYAYIVDFTDTGSTVLSRQSKKRLKMYKEDIGIPPDTLFDQINLADVEDKFKELEGLN